MCSRNGAATLADCLDGVLALQYANVEAIVVDDGSSDATPAIAGLYRVERRTELDTLCDPAVAAWLDRHGIRRATFREVGRR